MKFYKFSKNLFFPIREDEDAPGTFLQGYDEKYILGISGEEVYTIYGLRVTEMKFCASWVRDLLQTWHEISEEEALAFCPELYSFL